MNAYYNYKTGKNNMVAPRGNSKKGNFKPFVKKQPRYLDFVDAILTFIDSIIAFFASAKSLIAAKAVFSFTSLVIFLGVIGGIDKGTISLLPGVLALALISGVQYLVIRQK